VYYLLQTLTYDAHSGKSAVPGIDRKDLHQIQVPVPPLSEQLESVACMDRKLAELNGLIQRIRDEIDLIREYRTRLIADVVTGKLDVRDIDLPELDGDDEASEWGEAEGDEAEAMIDAEETADEAELVRAED
jgi:type I restriction enzyme S subunit